MTTDESLPATVGLDQVLRALSNDLLAAQKRALAEEHVGLAVASAEVELGILIQESRAKQAGLGIRVYALEAGADWHKGQTSSTSHKITINLVPAITVLPAPDSPTGPDGLEYKVEELAESSQVLAPALMTAPEATHLKMRRPGIVVAQKAEGASAEATSGGTADEAGGFMEA